MRKSSLLRRMLSFLLVFCLAFACSLGGTSAQATGEGDSGSTTVVATDTTGDVTWTLYDNGEFVLSGNGATAEYTSSSDPKLPPWNTNTEYKELIKRVVVEEGVTRLGSRLFYGCNKLTEVVFAENSTLTEIGDGVFRGCTSLTSITLPSSLTSLGRVCFYGDTALKTVVINGTMTTLPDQLFDGCDALESVTIPGTVTTLSAKSSNADVTTFYGITDKLTSIQFGGTIEAWKLLLANGNSDPLKSANITVTCSDGTYNYSSDPGQSGDGSEGEGDSEPATVVATGTTGTVTWTLYDNGEFVLSGNGATAEYTTSTDPTMPPWYKTEEHKVLIKKVIIEEGVTRLGSRLFYGCTNLAEVVFAENSTLTEIGEGVFRGCTSLTSITLPSSLTSLGRVCFYGDTALKTVVINGTMTTLPDQLFDGCSELASVTIPGTVTTLSAKSSNADVTTFYGITDKLTSIQFGGTIEAWKLLLANGNSDPLKSANITVTCSDGTYNYSPDPGQSGDGSEGEGDPEPATVVATGTTGTVTWTLYDNGEFLLSGNGATAEYTTSTDPTMPPWYKTEEHKVLIKKVIIEEGVTRLGARLFYGCTNLAEVDFSKNTALTEIGDGVFRGCTSLTSITLPDSLTSLGRVCFYGCSNLESIVFGGADSKLTSLYDQTTTNCGKLTTITLPASMKEFCLKDGSTTVGPFYNKVPVLDTIHYHGTISQWQALLAGTFSDEVKSGSITVYCSDGVYIDGSLGNGIVYSLDEGVLTLRAQLGEAAIPDFNSASDLPWAADAATITKVIVRTGITGIGANVFAGCVNITDVVYIGDETGWKSIEENSGENNEPLFNVTPICLASGKCGENATFTYDAETKCLTISGTGGTYDYVSGTSTPWGIIRDEIETVVVSEGITYLGDYLFNKAYSLSSVTLPVGLAQLEVFTFGYCTSLREVVFHGGLKIVGSKAFSGCSGLETLTLPGTVEAIDLKAFEGATSLTDVYYDGTEGDWNQIVISSQAQGNKCLLNANIHYLKSVQTFTDVEAGGIYYDAVTYLTDNGYLTVTTETFGVIETADMNMLLEMLYENAGSPGMYDSSMDWAVSNSLVDKGVNAEVSLSDLAVLLYRTAILNHQAAADSSVDEATAALTWCTGQQYFAQIDTNDQTVTRGEAALIMAAYLQSAASDADRSDEQLAVLKKALSVEGGDGKFYIYAPDLCVENPTTKRGDCFFILFPDGQTMLIDTAINTSEAIVLKMLDDLGVTGLDHLMFSHSDRDHVGNGVAVVTHLNGDVGKIYLNNSSQTQYTEIVAAAKSGAEVIYLRRGDSYEIGEVAVRIFNPSDQFINDYNAGIETQNNNSSIAVKFTYGESTFLTCGDLYDEMELEIVALYGDEIQADILKSNHHGAYTSDCDEWVDTVKPLIMFAETDDNGNTKLVNSAAERGIAYYTFGMDGAILITMDNSRNYEVLTQKDSVLRSGYTGEVGKVDRVIDQTAINVTPVIEVARGDADFTLEVSGGADELNYQFSSSDESVVTVDANGTVHIVGVGTATVTVAKIHDYYNTVSATVEISVHDSAIQESTWTMGNTDSAMSAEETETAEETTTARENKPDDEVEQSVENDTASGGLGGVDTGDSQKNGLMISLMISAVVLTAVAIVMKMQYKAEA